MTRTPALTTRRLLAATLASGLLLGSAPAVDTASAGVKPKSSSTDTTTTTFSGTGRRN